MNFTTTAIDALDLPEGEIDAWYWDRDGGTPSGLGIRLRRGKDGVSKTWYVTYRFGGEKKRLRLADTSAYTLADARVRTYEARRCAAEGTDPAGKSRAVRQAAVKAVTCPTFAEYAEHYLRRKLKDLRPKTYRERERYLAQGEHFAPFRTLRLNQIDRQMVAARVNFLEDKGVTKPSIAVAQAARMALLDLFKLAKAEGHIEINPVIGTPQPAPPRQQHKRERVLSSAESAAVWNAVGDDDYGRIVKLAILTGARREEIGGMRWSEIVGDTWTLPAKRAKNKRPLALPLPPAAMAIIRSVEREDGRDHLFGSRSTDGFTDWSSSKRKLDQRLDLAPWRLHDLRRTAITGMHELGIFPHIVEAVANHAPPSSVHNNHYNHAAHLADKADALRQWAEHIAKLTGENVVPFKPAV